ncbi:MAG: hypothetical protein ACYC2U_05915 [Candidatus Amoebophilus sp.]
MHLPRFKPQYYSFIVITILLLGVIACRDFEDCRSMYTNMAVVEFKGENELKISKIEYDNESPGKVPIKQAGSAKNQYVFYLHPRNNKVTLFFYKASDSIDDSVRLGNLTIFYTRVASLISPSCGIQQEYIIDSVESSFIKSTIVKPSLKKTAHETSEEKDKPNVEIQY